MSSKSIFLIGPGLIGWQLLEDLVAAGYSDITALVRRKEHGEAIQRVTSKDIKIIQGGLDDKELITKTTTEHDVTFHTATADHLPSVEAVLEGLRLRSGKGLESIYIHTSGASLLADDSRSAYSSDKVYTDADPAAIDALPDNAPHRPIDLTIANFVRQQNDDKIKIAIMTPPLIYGYNPKHDRLTIQIPTLTRFALKNGYAGHVGAGLGTSGGIHVHDLTRAYLTILKKFESSPATAAAEFRANPYVFIENGYEHTWKEVAQQILKSLQQNGHLKDVSAVKEIPEDQWDQLFGDFTLPVVGMNARSRGERLRKLGWEAKEKSLWESWFEDELPALLRQDGKVLA